MTSPDDQARAVLDEVNRAHGTAWTVAGPLAGGFQSGAWRIRDGDGRPAVLKWSGNASPVWAGVVCSAAPKVAAARAAGYPTPAWLACGTTADGCPYQVQEWVDGRPAERLTARLAAELAEVVEGVAAGRAPAPGADPRPGSWSRFVLGEMLGDTADGLRRTVAGLGSEAAALVGRFDALWARYGPVALPEGDLVHGDFHPGNVLLGADGRVAAVVDIEALGDGCRAVDYAPLWAAAEEAGDAEALRIVRQAGARAAGRLALAFCVAWNALELIRFVSGPRPALVPAKLASAAERAGVIESWLATGA